MQAVVGDGVVGEDVVGDAGVGFGAHHDADGTFDGIHGGYFAAFKTAFFDEPVRIDGYDSFVLHVAEEDGVVRCQDVYARGLQCLLAGAEHFEPLFQAD